jgi:hypothetical protein
MSTDAMAEVLSSSRKMCALLGGMAWGTLGDVIVNRLLIDKSLDWAKGNAISQLHSSSALEHALLRDIEE